MPHSFSLLKARQESLKKRSIPLILTHGVFSRRNFGFCADENGNDKIILFNWQHAAVSHPFFDFCEFHEKVDEKIVDKYLSYWSSYEQLEPAKEFSEIARRLGWLLRIYVQANCIYASGQQTHGDSPFEEELANTWIRLPTIRG